MFADVLYSVGTRYVLMDKPILPHSPEISNNEVTCHAHDGVLRMHSKNRDVDTLLDKYTRRSLLALL